MRARSESVMFEVDGQVVTLPRPFAEAWAKDRAEIVRLTRLLAVSHENARMLASAPFAREEFGKPCACGAFVVLPGIRMLNAGRHRSVLHTAEACRVQPDKSLGASARILVVDDPLGHRAPEDSAAAACKGCGEHHGFRLRSDGVHTCKACGTERAPASSPEGSK